MSFRLFKHGARADRPVRRRRPARTGLALVAAVAVLAVPALAEASVGDVNQQRAAAGLPPVAENPALTSLAQQQAARMAASSSLAHTGNLGGTVSSVVPNVSGVAENVGGGMSVGTINNMFMASPSHRAAILGNYNAAGVGTVVGRDGRVYVTQVFARVGGGSSAGPVTTRTVVHTTSTGRSVRTTSTRRSVRTRYRKVCRVQGGRKFCRRVATRRVVTTRRTATRHQHRHQHRHRHRHRR